MYKYNAPKSDLTTKSTLGSNNDPSSLDDSIPSSLMAHFPKDGENLSAMEDTAAQHFIIGDNLRHKAFYDDAIEEFQKALHIQEPLLGENSVTVAKTMYSMGLALRGAKEYKQALYHLAKASSNYENAENPGKFKIEILDCKLNMARTHHSQGVELQRTGDYDKSILEHRKALAIREHLLGRSHLETARSNYVMGCALSDRGDFDEALAELRRSLHTRLIVFGKEHMDTGEVLAGSHRSTWILGKFLTIWEPSCSQKAT
jgi:tetratricopeptide (TPR) repeat protein